MEWVPAWESLYETEKRGFLLAARGVLIGLSVWARKEQRDGLVRLARGITDPAEGIRDLLGGTLEEARAALEQLTDPEDPVVEIGGKPGRLTVRVLSSAAWALDGGRRTDEEASLATTPSSVSSSASSLSAADARRAAEAKRKRDARARGSSAGRDPGRGADARPDTTPDASASDPGHAPDASADATPDASAKRPDASGGRVADVGGERGGVSGVQTQKRSEETRADQKETETRSARASSPGRTPGRGADAPPDTTPDASASGTGRAPDASADATPDGRAGRLLATLRRCPELHALERGRQLDLERCVADLVTDGENYVMGGKLRLDEVDERLDAVVADIVREVASAASTSQPMPPREVARKMRTFATTTLSKSREDWQARRRPSRPGGPSSGTRARPSEAELDAIGLGGAR